MGRPEGANHGLTRLKRFVDVRGLTGIDARKTAMRAVRSWQRALLVDLGGEENITTQEKTLIEMATRTRLYIEHIDGWLMEQDSLINKRSRRLFPIVQQRQALVDSMAKLLTQLGLKRRAKDVETLDAYLERRGKELEESNGEQQPEAGAEHNPGDE